MKVEEIDKEIRDLDKKRERLILERNDEACSHYKYLEGKYLKQDDDSYIKITEIERVDVHNDIVFCCQSITKKNDSIVIDLNDKEEWNIRSIDCWEKISYDEFVSFAKECFDGIKDKL